MTKFTIKLDHKRVGKISHKEFSDIIDEIRNGKFKANIDTLRKNYDSWSKKERKEFKSGSFPTFWPCAYLPDDSRKSKNNYVRSTGLIQFDIDEINEKEVKRIKRDLINNISEVVYIFVSPSGRGIKFAINTNFLEEDKTSEKDIVNDDFKLVYLHLVKVLQSKIDLPPLDSAVDSIFQACYFSYDKDAYYNENAPYISVDIKSLRDSPDNPNNIYKEKNGSANSILTEDKEELLKAFKCIDRGLGNKERFKINYAVIACFGSEAEEILMNHWTSKNRKKLRDTIRRQIGDVDISKTSSDVIYKAASKNGYKSKEFYEFSTKNKKSSDTDDRPYYDPDISTLEQGLKKLDNGIKSFFSNKESTFINITAGAGKTHIVAESIYNSVWGVDKKQVKKQIAIYVRDTTTAEEFADKLIQLKRDDFEGSGLTSFQFLQERSLSDEHFVTLIKGRENSGCMYKKQPSLLGKDLKISDICRVGVCPSFTGCSYVHQFSPIYNIRIYTGHHRLFDNLPESHFELNDGGYLYKSKDGKKWAPDYVVIDEDIISNHILSSNEVIRTTKNDKPKSISKVIKDYYEQGMNLAEAVKINHSEIINDAKQYGKRLYDRDATSYSFLVQLKIWSNILQSSDDYIDDRFAVEESELVFYGKKKFRKFITDGTTPVLFLDASAIESVVNDAFDFQYNFVNVEIDYHDEVEVIQVENKNYSKASFIKNVEQRNKVGDFILREGEGHDYGIISYQYVDGEKFLRRKVVDDTDEDNLIVECIADGLHIEEKRVLHFGATRGLNQLENMDTLFLVGRHLIGQDVLFNAWYQLYGGLKHKDEIVSLITNSRSIEKVIRMRDGKNKSVGNTEYIFDQLKSLSQLFNDSETYQAIHRLRLIHKKNDRPTKKKRVFILTNRVLNITVDKLIRSDVVEGMTTRGDDKLLRLVNAIKEVGTVGSGRKALAELLDEDEHYITSLQRTVRMKSKKIGGSDTLETVLVQYNIFKRKRTYVYIADSEDSSA